MKGVRVENRGEGYNGEPMVMEVKSGERAADMGEGVFEGWNGRAGKYVCVGCVDGGKWEREG